MATMRREEGPLDFLTNLETSVNLFRSKGGVQGSPARTIPEENEDDLSSVSPYQAAGTVSSISQSIGPSVASIVSDALWVDDLKSQYEELEELRRRAGFDQDRCIVCTLPYGTCKHTQTWMIDRIDDTKDVVDKEVEEMLAFVGGSVVVETAPAEEDVDLDSMRWVHLEPAMSDKIGSTYLSLYSPQPRGWHSCTHLGQYVLMFGGFRYKKSKVPQPFGPATTKDEVEYLSDLAIFDTIGRSWHASPRRECSPGGRYGHIGIALDKDRMLIYGGRSSGGRFLSDTWVYVLSTDTWVALQPDSASPAPSPRVFSSATVHETDVYLFGGTDGVDNFGDLWIFHGDESVMRWERTVAVGIPPSPRYGHKIILVCEGKNTNTDTNATHSHMNKAVRGRLAVVGGCTVSPQSEVVGTAMTSQEIKTMLDLGNGLQNNYMAEGLTAHLGGSHLAASADVVDSIGGVRALYKSAASVAGQIHELEVQTREAEKNLVTQYHLMQASKNLKLQKAKHPNPLLDVIFLDVRDLTWKPQIYPPISGDVPSCRMHFGCTSLGGHIILVGGTRPTSLSHAPSEIKHTCILTLDLETFRWSQRSAVGSVESLDGPLQIADSDILRAKQRVAVEKDRGKALGARNGMTVELAEAEVVLNVCHWRRKMLLREKSNLREPPPPRWGASFDAVGCRAFYLGGWGANEVVGADDSFILDLEHEMERRRREMDEFHLKLERDRKNEQNTSNLRDMQSAYELRAMLLAEKSNEAKECHAMGVQDLISSIPPLSIPNPVRLVKVNDHTMWVAWDRLHETVTKQSIDPSTVRYNLYMISGYQNLTIEDRVLVMPLGAPGTLESSEQKGNDDDNISVLSEATARNKVPQKPAAASGPKSVASQASKSKADSSAKKSENQYLDYVGPGFPGEITGIASNDRFSVSFDDGTFEGNIHRRRIKLARKVYPDKLIRFNEDGTEMLPPAPPHGQDEESDEDQSKDSSSKKRSDRTATKYAHLLNEFNREALTIRSDMSWITQKRIMSKLKIREATVQRIKNIHPSYKRSSSSTILSNSSAVSGSPTSRAVNLTAASRQDHSNSSSDSDSNSDGDEDAVEDNALVRGRGATKRGKTKYGKRAVVEPTIKVPPEYSLIYSGNANSYELSGIVPLDVLRRDPQLTVPVKFVLQTAGLDFPIFEFSQLSTPATYYTRVMPSQEELLRGLDSLDDEENEELDEMMQRLIASQAGGGTNKMTGIPNPSVSRTKKQLLTAIVLGKEIVLEKQGQSITGTGEGDYFL